MIVPRAVEIPVDDLDLAAGVLAEFARRMGIAREAAPDAKAPGRPEAPVPRRVRRREILLGPAGPIGLVRLEEVAICGSSGVERERVRRVVFEPSEGRARLFALARAVARTCGRRGLAPLAAGLPAARYARRVVRDLARAVLSSLAALGHGDDPLAVLDGYEACRRLGRAARLFDAVLPELSGLGAALAPWSEAFSALRALGFLEERIEAWSSDLPATSKTVSRVLRVIRSRRDQARADFVSDASGRLAGAASRLEDLAGQPAEPREDGLRLGEFSAGAVRSCGDRMLADRSGHAEGLPVEHAQDLLFALDALRPALPETSAVSLARATSSAVERASRVRDSLRAAEDLRDMSERGEWLGGPPCFLLGVMAERHGAVARRMLSGLDRAFERLEDRLERFLVEVEMYAPKHPPASERPGTRAPGAPFVTPAK